MSETTRTVKLKFLTADDENINLSLKYASEDMLDEEEGPARVRAVVTSVTLHQPFIASISKCESAEVVETTTTPIAFEQDEENGD